MKLHLSDEQLYFLTKIIQAYLKANPSECQPRRMSRLIYLLKKKDNKLYPIINYMEDIKQILLQTHMEYFVKNEHDMKAYKSLALAFGI